LLGALVTPAELGIYTIAFFLAMALKEIVKKVMSSVFYPALSEVVRTRPHELKQVYYRIRTRLDIVVMVIVGIMASSGSLVIDILYDDRYADAGWMLEILSLSIIFLGTTMAGICLMALGNSKSIMVLTAVSSVFLFISVPLAYDYFGFYGAVVAIALNAIVEIPIIVYLMKRYKIWSWFHELKTWPLFFLVFGLCRYLGEVW
jgi:O-antigen/teichoic acid export membrane protein